ncbi:MAG: SirB1 family protein [Halothece sp.]
MISSLGRENFYSEINQRDDGIDLGKAALYIAQEEYPNLIVEEYLNALDTMANEIQDILPEEHYPLKVIQTINAYLYEDLGFRGNQQDYYDPRNSFLNDVIERRTGIPITLSLVYLEVARRVDFPMVGIGMPGHFIIKPMFEGAGIFVDAFNQGEVLFEQVCEARLQQIYSQPVSLQPRFLEPVSNRQFLFRMLTNLKMIYLHQQAFAKALAAVERILLLFPDNPLELRDRGLLYYQSGDYQAACEDLEMYLSILPNAEDGVAIRQLIEQIC